MTREFAWKSAARRYLALYRKIAPNATTPDVARDPVGATFSQVVAA
jgi:hypothetical protein